MIHDRDGLEEEYLDLVNNRFNGSVIDMLESVTVQCEDFILTCKLGMRREFSSDVCCGKVFKKQARLELG